MRASGPGCLFSFVFLSFSFFSRKQHKGVCEGLLDSQTLPSGKRFKPRSESPDFSPPSQLGRFCGVLRIIILAQYAGVKVGPDNAARKRGFANQRLQNKSLMQKKSFPRPLTTPTATTDTMRRLLVSTRATTSATASLADGASDAVDIGSATPTQAGRHKRKADSD